MTASDAPVYTKSKEFSLSDAEFNQLRTLVHDKTGISLSQAKRELVYGRLVRRLRALKLERFSDYIAMVEDEHPEEMQEFINAITTNLTSFYREPHHFEVLAGTVLPQLVKSNAGTRKIRIWCSASSTGEEPYTIAMTIRENESLLHGFDVRILATDLDTNCVAHAKRGIYTLDRVKDLSRATLTRWFDNGPDDKSVQVKKELQNIVSFGQLNLMDPWPIRGPLDVIFCRNVVIYFDKDAQRRLFDRMADLMPQGGHLFLGHSETLFKVSTRFELIGRTVYKRAGP